MNRNFLRAVCAAVTVLAAGCDQLGLGPRQAASSPAPQATQQVPDFRSHAGETYPAFAAAAGASYSPDELGLNAVDRARLWRAMAAPSPAQLVEGGGAEVLVFLGCAETGCEAGLAVVGIDVATGGVFAGVRDAGGAEVLAPNDRVEALLRLHAPTRRWSDLVLTQTAAADVATP